MLKIKLLKWMCYTVFPLFSVIVILVLAWFLSGLLELFINNQTMFRTLDQTTKYSKKLEADALLPGNSPNNIFWFVQLSDLHISQFRDYGQVKDLKLFCETILQKIGPDFVLVTGDLTDAKDESLIGSSQYVDEWKMYASVLVHCQDFKWLDIRGNHDDFGVSDKKSSENLFNKFAASKLKYDESAVYQYIHQKSFGKYSFNGIDLAPNPGPARPFNFFAVLEKETLHHIQVLAGQAHNYNTTVWFGHYPLSVTSKSHILRELLASGVAYLCGHLHTLLGTFPQMHAVHSEGFLEIELGDWKENRRYRIAAIDHDMLSFVDVSFPSKKPIVLVTNPVDARYLVPGETSYQRCKHSTHIRFLVFHDVEISEVIVSVDDIVICSNPTAYGPLFVCPWSAASYAESLHKLKIHVESSDKQTHLVELLFSLDGTRPPLGIYSTVLLLTDFYTMARLAYAVAIAAFILLPFCLKKFPHHPATALTRDRIKSLAPQILRFIDCDEVFWPFIYYSCCVSFGPSSFGYLFPNELSILFPFGIISWTNYIPGSLTYLYTAVQLMLFNSIIMLYVGEVLNVATNISICQLFAQHSTNRMKALLFNIMLLFLIWVQLTSSYMFLIAYGKLSWLFNPSKTWSIPVIIYFIIKAHLIRPRLR